MLYYAGGKIEFKNLYELVNTFSLKKKYIYVYTNEFKELVYLFRDAEKKEYRLKGCNRLIGFMFQTICFRDMKYYHGTDKYHGEIAAQIAQNNIPKIWNSSFTGYIGKEIDVEAIKKDFPRIKNELLEHMIYDTSKGSFIFSHRNRDYENVFENDITSAYPTIMMEPVPWMFVKLKESDDWKKFKYHFGKITVKKMKWKINGFTPVYNGFRGKDINKVVYNEQGIIAAEEFSYYGFIEHELDVLKVGYEYESIQISDCYGVIFKMLPESTISKIKELFDGKSEAKGTVNYEGTKQLFNRVFGFFVSKIEKDGKYIARDSKIPYSVGLWIISRQRHKMTMLADKIGFDNIVAGHTDSLITTIDCRDLLKEKEIYKNIGFWKTESIKKIHYFTNTKAKYIKNGKLQMKHGGIDDNDIEDFLKDKTYNDITKDSNIYFTCKKLIIQNKKGIFIMRYKKAINIKLEIKKQEA